MTDRLTQDQKDRLKAAGFEDDLIEGMNTIQNRDNPELVAFAVDFMIVMRTEESREGCDPLQESFDMIDTTLEENEYYKNYETEMRKNHMKFLIDIEGASEMTLGQRLFVVSTCLDSTLGANAKAANQLNARVYTTEQFEEISKRLLAETQENTTEARA